MTNKLRIDKNKPDALVAEGEEAIVYGLGGVLGLWNGHRVLILRFCDHLSECVLLSEQVSGAALFPTHHLMHLDVEDYMTISSYTK